MKNRTIKLFLPLIVLAICAFFCFFGRQLFTTTPWATTLSLEFPSFITTDENGDIAVIDRSLKRIVRFDANGKVVTVIHGGSKQEGQFWFADEISIDSNGNLYVLNRIMDNPGFYTVASEILMYTRDGKFVKTVYRIEYDDSQRISTLVQRGHFLGLKAIDTTINVFEANQSGLVLHQGFASSSEITSKMIYSLQNADSYISSADISPDNVIWWVDKRGTVNKLISENNGDVILKTDNGEIFPWKIRAGKSAVFVSDIANQKILKLDSSGIKEFLSHTILEESGISSSDNLCYSLSINSKDTISYVNGDGPIMANVDGNLIPIPVPEFTMLQIFLTFLWWFALLTGIVSFIILLMVIYKDFFNRKLPRLLKTVIALISITALVSVLVGYLILENFSKRYEAEVINKLEQIVNLVPEYIDVDRMMSIQSPAQYMGTDYMAIREQVLRAVYGKNNNRNKGFYFALHRVKDDGKLYTFMWLNGEPGIWHPFNYLLDPELSYQSTLKGESSAYSSLDPWGSWMLATAPLVDKNGKVVGVFEMGGDFYAFTQENQKLIQQLFISIGTVLLILLLVIVEGMFLSDTLRKKSQTKMLLKEGYLPRRDEDVYHRVFLVRPLTGIFFAATSMSLLFLPLMMKQLLSLSPDHIKNAVAAINPELLYGLPLSARLLLFGLGSILSGVFVERFGWRRVFIVGLGITCIGLVGAALFGHIGLFLISSAVLGLGTGFCTVGLRAIIGQEENPAIRSTAFTHFYSGLIAGTNLGVMGGSWLADFIGYVNVFWISSFLMIIVFIITFKLMPKDEEPQKESSSVKNKSSSLHFKEMTRFVFSPNILSFFIMIILPVYTISMVLGYFFPIFGNNAGLNNAALGRYFLINGLIVIYLGPVFSNLVRRIFKIKSSIILSSLLWILSLVPFIMYGTLPSLIFTIILMGIAEGIAVSTQNDFYFSLPAVQELGNERSIGAFEVFGKLGETIAPILLALVMMFGPQQGLFIIALSSLLFLVLYLVITNLSKKGSPS